MDNQKRAAQRKAKKRRKDSSAHVAPTLDDALPLATCKVYTSSRGVDDERVRSGWVHTNASWWMADC